ncbi:SDR family NAD(P)-dependent oxidoreductase [Thalassotalea piscium]
MPSKTICITGATSGIGYALFEQYAKQGHKVIACGRNTTKLTEMGDRAYKTCQFDVTLPEEVMEKTKDVGPIDILILNAGNCRYIDNATSFDAELFSDVITTNLISLSWLLKYLLPKVKHGGQVVFVSSSATILPFPKSEAYGASKAGVDYLANSLRLDLMKENIAVTLVHPGFVQTPLTDKNTFEMPFLITSDEAASRMIDGIEARKKYLHFPKRLTLLLKLFALLPSSIWQAIITRKPTI